MKDGTAWSEIDDAVVWTAILKLPRVAQHSAHLPRHTGRIADLTLRTGLARNRILEALRRLRQEQRVAVEWRRDADPDERPWAEFLILNPDGRS